MGKMLKYEFKATWKFMLIMFLCLCVASVAISVVAELNKDAKVPLTADNGYVLDYVSESWIWGVAGSVFMMAGAVILMVCFAVIRFAKVLTHKEGYLVRTLPVGESSVITSKLVTFIVYALPIVSVPFICFLNLIFNSGGGIMAGRLGGELAIATNGFNPTTEQIAGYMVSFAGSLAGTIMSLLQLYAAMAIGFSFNRNKKAWSVVALVAVSMITRFVVELLQPIRNRISYMQSEDIIIILFEIAVAVIFFFITYYFMKKRPCVE